MKILRGILLQVGVVCSFVCIIAKILDWYNPYMDFSGHVWYVQMLLCVVVILLEMAASYRRSGKRNKFLRNKFLRNKLHNTY